MTGVLQLLAGVATVVVPGLALLLAAGVRDKVWLAGLTAPASVGVYALTGVASGVPGLPFGPWLALGVAVVVVAVVGVVAWLLRRRGLGLPPEPAEPDHSFLPALSPGISKAAKLGGAAMVLLALVLAFEPWRRGMGGWSTYPQEHDSIVHTLLAGYITHTGNAAPWELLPLDMLTGQPVAYYPSGLPITVALSGELAGGPIVGYNVIVALMLGPVFVLGCAALTAAVLRRLRFGPEWTIVGGGVAAIVAAGLFRPGFNMMHVGGIAPNAVALALTPGVLAAIFTIGRGQWARALVLGIAVAGTFSVHPSVAVSIGASAVVYLVVEAFTKQGRATLRGQWPVLAGAAVAAGLAGLGALLGAATQANRTGNFPADIGPLPLGEAVGTNIMMSFGEAVAGRQVTAELTAAVLVLAGAIAVFMTRRAWGALALWSFWMLISIVFRMNPNGIVGNTLGGFFYKSYVRIQSHVSLFVPLMITIAVLFTVAGVARFLATREERFGALARSRGVLALGLVVVVMLGYGITASVPYAKRNAQLMATRWARPHFVRVDDDDQKAARWLAERIKPGERVMNSANDGSTNLYTEYDIPVVNIVTLGAAQLPYTYELLDRFRNYSSDPAVLKMILDLNIAYVYFDTEAPVIGAGGGAPENWLHGAQTFRLPPGLLGLEGLPGLSVGFHSGSVTVYQLDRRVLEGLRAGNTATP
ncbi:DUF6541 family protein [Amycolatopsis suaedae]|uniref:Uncharacterized protein n=1 Tax=Amycolatopsis suaedae TaxID=2510978 RepID=A0A4Q7J3H2_9PSEU|nr:DUF6541 family protein [Amycolatopsis suaedae]RZQ62051.1 hypothetical protein EWH70_20910 [Amycolatopsis suaedae]